MIKENIADAMLQIKKVKESIGKSERNLERIGMEVYWISDLMNTLGANNIIYC